MKKLLGIRGAITRAVPTAGDVNGDGYSDVITGEYRYNVNTGRANLYFGSAISAKPILVYAKDVPNDQGGKVNLKWAKSSLEAMCLALLQIILYLEVFHRESQVFSGFK